MKRNLLIERVFLACILGATWVGAGATSVPARSPVSVEIVADDGRVYARYDLHDHSRAGTWRAYVEAERGRHYGIRVRNRTGGRVGLVIAVDGRNILSGEQSHLRSDEPMYVLGARDTATYAGWRTSDTRVHRFFFTEAESSYAEAWGDRSAMGVIAVAAFRERPRVQPPRAPGRQERAPGAASPSEPAADRAGESVSGLSAPGTGFGDDQYSRSVRVHFQPEHHPFARQFLKYEWRETLVRLGIIRDAPPANRFWPEQVGQMSQTREFAPYPPGYWSRRR